MSQENNVKVKSKPDTFTAKTRRTSHRRGERGQKSATAFRTISEVASQLGVQQHVLRFWESKFSQVKPLKRGGGRRYYRPEDVEMLENIHHYLYVEGYTIKGVQKLLQANRGKLETKTEATTPAPAEKAPEKSIETLISETPVSVDPAAPVSQDEVERLATEKANRLFASYKLKYKQELAGTLKDLKQLKSLLSLSS